MVERESVRTAHDGGSGGSATPASAQGPLVGILGGMGPAATADFYSKLIAATPASSDQEHLRVMIWADPTIPDRSRAIVAGGEDPTPKLAEGVRKLKEAGAAFFVAACNGSHAFLPRVLQEVDLECLSMIEVTAEHISAQNVPTAGVLASDATITAELYQQSLRAQGVEPILPDPEDQRVVMDTIYAVKAGGPGPQLRAELHQVVEHLIAKGADVIVAGCTEVPLVLTSDELSRPLIDPATVLVDRVIEEAARRTPSAETVG